LWHAVLRDSTFYATLTRFDHDLADAVRAAGCGCGGRLDRARYPRKPRGGPPGLGAEYEWRLSFCCARDGCRRRLTPPSVRYLGRRVYLGVVVVLVSAMTHGLSVRRVAALHAHLGVGLRTLRRWRQWWRQAFVESRFWRAARGRFMPAVEEPELPASLLARFGGQGAARVFQVLELLAPLTTRSAPNVRGAVPR
jgi:hypothetical protein